MKHYAPIDESDVVKVETCAWSPPGCHPVGCGMYLHVKDGKVVKVEGDESHPLTQGRLCPRCIDLPEFLYNEDRVIYPMKRAVEDRGKNKWERITWDEALDIIDEKAKEIIEKYTVKGIMLVQGTGRQACIYSQALVAATYKTPNVTFPMSGISCYGPRCMIADFILGAGYPELDYAQYFPDRYDNPDYEVPKYIILWGKDPLYSSPDGFFGHALIDLMKRGSKLITVDPRVTWCGTRAEYHLQLRPGTDTAVALGMLNVIINEDLYDHEFVENWCYGFDELTERVQEYPPEKVEEISWVPAETLRAAARAFATAHPSSIMWGVAVDMQQNGQQAGHAILSLAAITGNLDCPGGLTLAPLRSFLDEWEWEANQQVSHEDYLDRICEEKYKGFKEANPLAHPDSMLKALQSDEPYPIRMCWFDGTNMFANTTAVQPHQWYEALKKMEFNVIQDVFMTPTAMAVCDLFLPLSSFAEQDALVLPHFGRNSYMLVAVNKAVTVGDTKSDLEIDMWLGMRTNPEYWSQWPTVEDFFTDNIKASGLTFPELQEKVHHQLDCEYYKYATGKLRGDGELGFNTPTGLVELSSTLYPDWGEDALPYFQEPYYSPYSDKISDEEKEKYPFILTTGGRKITSFHSEHRQMKQLRDIDPWPVLTIHPDAAEKLGISDGDWVAIENSLGRAKLKASLSPVVDPRVVHATHGWWFPEQDGEEPNLFGVWKSSVNSLIPTGITGIVGFGANYKSIICSVTKVESLDD